MELRVKIIYITTAATLALLLVMQGIWLWEQYSYKVNQYEADAEFLIVSVVEKEMSFRRKQAEIHKANVLFMTNIDMGYYDGNSTVTKIDAYLIDTLLSGGVPVSMLIDNSRKGRESTGVKYFEFKVADGASRDDLYAASQRFLLDEYSPFSVIVLDSLLKVEGFNTKIEKLKIDSMVWKHTTNIANSILTPSIKVYVPYDNLQGELVCVVYEIPHMPIIVSMAKFLLLSLFLSVLIIFSLFYQIATIRKQQRIDEVRRDFLYTMIHELKRPISTLKMCVSAMRNEKLMNNTQFKDEVLQNSHNELDNLTSYFSKLRDITFSDDGIIPLNLTQLELGSFLNRCVSKIPLPPNKDVNIEVRVRGDMLITSDSMHLHNIMHNLIENAIKYSGDKVDIIIDYFENQDYYVIEVSDNGKGIDANDLPHIFDKFYRGPGILTENISGMGLGLSYVKMLTEAHRGIITIESQLFKGTKVTIKIPTTI